MSPDLNIKSIGPGSIGAGRTALSANGNKMEINLQALASNNNGEEKKQADDGGNLD